jgi:2TM domain
MKTSEDTKYERAQHKVKIIKGFYKHLRVYIIINLFLLLIRAKIFRFLRDGDFSDVHFERWLDYNSYGTILVWGVALLIHGLYAFQYKFKFFKNWEDRKLKEILEKDEFD